MKHTLVLLLLFCVQHVTYGQKKPTIDQLIDKVNRYLLLYNKLSPFDDTYTFKQLELPQTDIDQLLSPEAQFDQVSDTSISNYDMIFYTQQKIYNTVNQLVSHPEVKNISLAKVLNSEISIVKSADQKLYNFSIDEKMGGSYRSRISWMYFAEFKQNTLYNGREKLEEKELPPVFSPFVGDGYNSIDTIHCDTGYKYLLRGSVVECNTCFKYFYQLVSYENGQFKTDFYYGFTSRDYTSQLDYNPTTRSIMVNYNTDDLTSECNCQKDEYIDDTEPSDWNTEEDIVLRNCDCTFTFNRNNFELTKSCIEKMKID